jgi:hypothetical protein
MSVLDDEFEEFWVSFPRHVGKLAARQAYYKARTMANAKELLDGVARYMATKPSYADWCHPRTWLSQGRWLDQPDSGSKPALIYPCPHDPKCATTWACGRVQQVAQEQQRRHGK